LANLRASQLANNSRTSETIDLNSPIAVANEYCGIADWNATNTPLGKDLVREYVDACREFGLRIGFYHSLIDWHHPDYLVDMRSPRRDDDVHALNEGRDWSRYVDYLHGQVRELLTNYGQIDYMWFDFSSPQDPIHPTDREAWRSDELIAMIRELQPDIVINDRLDVACDTTTPEQFQPVGPVDLKGASLWEACQTINGSWGYHRDNRNAKTPDLMVRMLVDGVSKDGNLLLNIGPDGRGRIDDAAASSFSEIGRWMKLHERSVRGCGPSEFTAPPDVRYTQRGDRLYAHLFACPMNLLHLPGLSEKIAYAQLLNDASEIAVRDIGSEDPHSHVTPEMREQSVATLVLPAVKPDVAVPVVEIFLKS